MRGDVEHAAQFLKTAQLLQDGGRRQGFSGPAAANGAGQQAGADGGKRKESEASHARYFWTVNATEYSVFSHINFKVPPSEGLFSMAMVNWSTGFSSAVFFRSTRATSSFSSYAYAPTCRDVC